MRDMTEPATATVGDRIAHDLMPDFTMPVEDVRPCEQSSNRYFPHSQYKVTDPEGQTDWLCAFDVHKAGQR